MSYIEKILSVNEKVVFQSRQHVIVLLSHIFKTLLLIIALFVLGSSTLVLTNDPASRAHALQPVGYIFFVLSLVPIIWCLGQWRRWMAEQYLVTTKRIIQIGGVLNKSARDSSLEKVNDILMNQTMLGRMLDYADVEIVTGNESGVNKLDKIARPLDFKKTLLDAKENYERSLSGADRSYSTPAPVPVNPPVSPRSNYNAVTVDQRGGTSRLRPEEHYDDQRKRMIAEQPTSAIPLQNMERGQNNRVKQELSIPDQIAQLARLRDDGIISDEEFQAKKMDMLSRM